MKIKRWILLLVVWILTSALGCLIMVEGVAKHTFEHPFLIQTNGSETVVVDDNYVETNLVRLDSQDRVTGKIYYERTSNDAYHMAWRLLESEGNWYLMDGYNDLGETGFHFDFYQLDFEREEMVLIYQDLGSIIQKSLNRDDLTFRLDYCMELSMEGETLYMDITGINEQLQPLVLSLRLEHGECTLEKVRVYENYVRDMDGTDEKPVYLYQLVKGLYCGEQRLSDSYFSLITTSRENKIYAVNKTAGVVQQVLPETRVLQLDREWSLNNLDEYGVDPRGISALSIINEDNYAIAYYDTDDPKVVCVRNGVVSAYGTARVLSPAMTVLGCVMVCVALLVLEIGLGWGIGFLWRHGSVAIKLMAAMIPLMLLVSFVASFVVYFQLTAYHKRQDQDTMESIARELDSLGMYQSIQDFHMYAEDSGAYRDEMYLSMRSMVINISSGLANIPSVWEQESQQKLPNLYRCSLSYYGLDQQVGDYLCVYGHSPNVYLGEMMPQGQLEVFMEQLESQSPPTLFSFYTPQQQRLSALLWPTYYEDGSVNGFYLITADRIEGDDQILEVIAQFSWYQLVLCVVLLVLFATVIVVSLKPLAQLRRKAKLLMNGEMPTFDPPRETVRNEISDLASTFQHLAAQVGENMEQMQHLQRLSKAYFSPQILGLLGKESIAQLHFDESVTMPLYIAYIHVEQRSFEQMQQLMKQMIGWLKPCDGFFAQVSWRDLVVVSRENDLFYAVAAAAQEDTGLQVVFDYTPVVVKVAGTEPEYRFLVMPENQNRAESLCMYRDALHVRLLATEGSFPLDKSELRVRKVGMMDQQGLMECFLDAFANRRRLGQQDLEQGVELFFQGKPFLARTCFVQALRSQPGDPVALYYINLIDALWEQMQKEEHM